MTAEQNSSVQQRLYPGLVEAVVEGARHASQALSKWLGKQVVISTDGFSRLALNEIYSVMDSADEPVAAVQMGVTGDLSGHVLLTLPLPSAQWVAKQLLQCDAAPDLYEDDLARSCLQETGNIVGSTCIGSIASWLDVVAKPTAPRLAIDLPSALLQPLLIEQAAIADVVLLAKTDFRIESGSVNWAFYMLPSPESLRVIEKRCQR